MDAGARDPEVDVLTQSVVALLLKPVVPLSRIVLHDRRRKTARPLALRWQHRPPRLTQAATERLETRIGPECTHEKLVACCHIANPRHMTVCCQRRVA